MRSLLLVAVAVATFVAGQVAAPAAASPTQSPAQLRDALLAANYRTLPTGFYTAKVTTQKTRWPGQVASVMVDVAGPALANTAYFSIYETPAKAAAQMRRGELRNDDQLKISNLKTGRIPGWGKEGLMKTATVTVQEQFGKATRFGITVLAVRRGNVLVSSLSASSDSEESGDILSARHLLAWAVKHLERVRR